MMARQQNDTTTPSTRERAIEAYDSAREVVAAVGPLAP